MSLTAAPVRPDHVLKENYRLFVVLNYIAYLGFAAHSFFIPLFFWVGVEPLAYFNFFSVAAWVVGYFLNRNGRHGDAILLICSEVIIHAILSIFFLGWESGFHYYFMPLVLFVFINHKQTITVIVIEAVLIFIGYSALFLYTHSETYSIDIPQTLINSLLFMNIAINFTALGLLGYNLRVSSMRAENEMEKLATVDVLTQLFNRRKMVELIDIEKVRFQRDGKSFVLANTDIDHFKRFNDSFGHDCGDYVLKEVSKLLQHSLREQDMVARWGGEEFLILLPDTDADGAFEAIEKLRQSIEDTNYHYGDDEFSVTMTFGIAEFDGSEEIDDVIKHADEVLYAGKRGGRNRVIVSKR